MGYIIRFPFFVVAAYLWTFVGGAISLLNIITLPVFGIASVIMPSFFKTNSKDILRFGTLRRGYAKLWLFFKYGL